MTHETVVVDEQIADASLANYGGMAVLTPLTPDGWLWIDENLADERTEYAGGIVIEHRYVNPILEAMDRYGLTVDFLSD